MRSVFLWRAFLLTLFPPLAVLAAGQALWFVVALLAGDVLALAIAGGFASLVAIPLLFGRARELALLVALGCVLVMVSALALILYPISTQTASLDKVLQPSDYRLSEGLE
jgi:hypothetical protein